MEVCSSSSVKGTALGLLSNSTALRSTCTIRRKLSFIHSRVGSRVRTGLLGRRCTSISTLFSSVRHVAGSLTRRRVVFCYPLRNGVECSSSKCCNRMYGSALLRRISSVRSFLTQRRSPRLGVTRCMNSRSNVNRELLITR